MAKESGGEAKAAHFSLVFTLTVNISYGIIRPNNGSYRRGLKKLFAFTYTMDFPY